MTLIGFIFEYIKKINEGGYEFADEWLSEIDYHPEVIEAIRKSVLIYKDNRGFPTATLAFFDHS